MSSTKPVDSPPLPQKILVQTTPVHQIEHVLLNEYAPKLKERPLEKVRRRPSIAMPFPFHDFSFLTLSDARKITKNRKYIRSISIPIYFTSDNKLVDQRSKPPSCDMKQISSKIINMRHRPAAVARNEKR